MSAPHNKINTADATGHLYRGNQGVYYARKNSPAEKALAGLKEDGWHVSESEEYTVVADPGFVDKSGFEWQTGLQMRTWYREQLGLAGTGQQEASADTSASGARWKYDERNQDYYYRDDEGKKIFYKESVTNSSQAVAFGCQNAGDNQAASYQLDPSTSYGGSSTQGSTIPYTDGSSGARQVFTEHGTGKLYYFGDGGAVNYLT